MDVQQKLADIIRLVEDARAMPMSASCLVNREEMLQELDQLRALLPEQLQQADVLLSDRDAVVEGGRDAAQRLLSQARAEHDRLLEEQAVVFSARERAEAILVEANAESTRLLSDADDYVDRKLAEFEIALQKLTQQVVRGRTRLSARRAADLGRLAAPPDDDEPDRLGESSVDEPLGRHEAQLAGDDRGPDPEPVPDPEPDPQPDDRPEPDSAPEPEPEPEPHREG
jgi:cell division septum initiation protein DivIVA